MKKILTTLLIYILMITTFVACNADKSKNISNNAHQQANNTRSFPRARATDNVICHNCRATFKLSANMQKFSNGVKDIKCPICHIKYK